MDEELEQQVALNASGKSRLTHIALAMQCNGRTSSSRRIISASTLRLHWSSFSHGGRRKLNEKLVEDGFSPVVTIQSTCKELYTGFKDVKNMASVDEDKYKPIRDVIAFGRYFWLRFEMRRTFRARIRSFSTKSRRTGSRG